MIYKIKIYGDTVLNKKAEEVTDFNREIKEILDNMLETMYAQNGVGLAANQVGILKQLITMDTGPKDSPKPIKMINPVIIEKSREKTEYEEGCLSFPGITEKIYRPSVVKVKFFDQDGNEKIMEFKGLESTVSQHEIDHLNGVLFINRMSAVKKMMLNKKLKELKRR
ncbi:MAG TPA: peptide deformylase [Candidatus Goldiibacteriota bacterium]|nr:peptide deformylase [Candidatus Goldiibacteriota bacterium]